ncbi:MAG TPA: RNA polymerase subunit sigma-70 [Lachnospiraceae bacterium]|nr:RNA polymerase subunit sigma-70 [Lachnospiraceae bacterium]
MEESEIIELFWQRKEEAVCVVKEKYGNLCMHIANNILHNRQDAEECENDGYLKLWNSIPPNRPLPLMPYLCRIVRNLALNRYEYNNAQKRGGSMDEIFVELDETIASSHHVEDELWYSELVQEINIFLQNKKKEQRRIFLARYYFAASIKEIAQKYELSESKVKSVLFRMRKDLKAQLEEEGYL